MIWRIPSFGIKHIIVCVITICMNSIIFATVAFAEPTGFEARDTPYARGLAAYKNYDDITALRWFTESAKQGNPKGQIFLGMMHVAGDGVASNISEGMGWIERAAEQGDAAAQVTLATLLLTTDGAAEDDPQQFLVGMRWLRCAADKEYVPAMNMLAQMYFVVAHVDSGDAWITDIPESIRVEIVEVMPKSQDEAIRMSMRAADFGDASALVSLGRHYEYGDFAPKSETQALFWYKAAADRGDASGQIAVGNLYEFGDDIFNDYAEAVRWYRRAADQGSALGQYYLAGMYHKGSGVPENGTEAVRLYRLAANQNHRLAQAYLGRIYRYGDGVPINYVEAYKWYNILSATNDRDTVSRDAKEELKLEMTASQIAHAQRLSTEWTSQTDRSLDEMMQFLSATN